MAAHPDFPAVRCCDRCGRDRNVTPATLPLEVGMETRHLAMTQEGAAAGEPFAVELCDSCVYALNIWWFDGWRTSRWVRDGEA